MVVGLVLILVGELSIQYIYTSGYGYGYKCVMSVIWYMNRLMYVPLICSFSGQLIHGAMRLEIVHYREPVAYPDDLSREIIYFNTNSDRLRMLAI